MIYLVSGPMFVCAARVVNHHLSVIDGVTGGWGKGVSGPLRACLQGGRVTLASGLTLAGGSKIARVYKQNFTGRVTLPPGTT